MSFLPLRFLNFWLSLGILMLVLGLAVALMPPVGLSSLNVSDKLLHTLAFAIFMAWFGGLVEFREVSRVALALVLYGILIELLQGQTELRQADPADVIADITGILLGWVLCAAGLRHWCSRVESWLEPRKSPKSP